MTKEQYITITQRTAKAVSHLPLGEKALQLPTAACAAVYLGMLCLLAVRRDGRIVRAMLVPAAIFILVTLLRPVFNRKRPYDAFCVPPVGKWERGKGKSMPSRHAASAAAIAFAVMWVHPSVPVIAGMSVLCILVCTLRVLTGKHYPSDVAAALLLAGVISYFGFFIL